MKKMMAVLTVVLTLCGCFAVTVSAEPTTAQETVYVTIADQNGDLALVMEAVALTDKDGDEALTINDALIAAHEMYFADGVGGYQTAQTEYGLSMTKLWGCENGSAFGYYLNDVSAWSLTDAVKNGDRINAFVYTDLTAWSDTYCYFDAVSLNIKEGETISLTLKAASFDEAYNPITVPVADAVLTVNGELTTYVTDAEGKVSLTLDGGNHVISAVSDTKTLVPPVCKVMAAIDGSASNDVSTDPSVETVQTTTVAVAQSTASTTAVQPEDHTDVLVISLVGIGVALVAVVIGIVLIVHKKK